MRKNIMVPYDGSNSAHEALLVAIDMAEKYKESVLLINVQPNFITPHTTMYFKESDIHEYQQALYKEAVAPGLSTLKQSGIEFEAKLLIGYDKDEICNEAEERQIRCIVMGSRGHGPLKGSILGSVSQGVLQRGVCPVMIIPANTE